MNGRAAVLLGLSFLLGLFPAAQSAVADTLLSSTRDAGSDGASAEEGAWLTPEIIARYAEVGFDEMYVTPAGPRGLEYTGKIKHLDGELVRVTGFMVRIVSQDPDTFMFTERPVSTHSCQIGGVPEVPATVVHAVLPKKPGCGTAWQPYAVTVLGRLELGGREEIDGRYSYVRIRADYITVGERFQTVDLQIPLVRRVLGRPGAVRGR